MYLSVDAVLAAIRTLRSNVHPFIGIPFVALKRHGLRVGAVDEVGMGNLMRAHMDRHHRIDRRSAYYLQPFISAKWWLEAEKYPSGGLQTIYTQTFKDVFLHVHGDKSGGSRRTI